MLAKKEIRIPHLELQNSQTITNVQEDAFKTAGLDTHVNECKTEDDFSTNERVYKVKQSRKVYYLDSKLPWH